MIDSLENVEKAIETPPAQPTARPLFLESDIRPQVPEKAFFPYRLAPAESGIRFQPSSLDTALQKELEAIRPVARPAENPSNAVLHQEGPLQHVDTRAGKGPPPVELLKAPDGGTYAEWLAKPMEPFTHVEINPANTLSGKGEILVSAKKMHKDGYHFNEHGRQMGYNSAKEYDAAAKEFVNRYQDHPNAVIKEGELNIGREDTPNPIQRVIEHDDLAVIIDVESGQIKNFYDGNEHKALIEIKRVR